MKRRRTKASGKKTTGTENIALAACEILLEKKGVEPVVLDVRGLSDVTDYMVIVTGENALHIKALKEEVERQLAQKGYEPYREADEVQSGWVVLDYLDFMVHIFTRELRAYYALEDLWGDARVVTASASE